MVRLIMENGGTELDQLDPSRKDFLNQLLTNKDDTQA